MRPKKTASAAAPAPARPTKLLIYRGVYHDPKKKLSRWIKITESEFKAGFMLPKVPERDALYDRKVGRRYEVGHVVSVEYDVKNPSSIYAATMRYRGQWPNKAECLAWAAEAKEHEMRIEEEAARDAVGDPLVEQLLPIRQAYRRSVGYNRTRLLAAVVAIITGGGS